MAFNTMPAASDPARREPVSTESLVSKIIISLEYVDAEVNRVLEVPVDITLDELHDIILDSWIGMAIICPDSSIVP